MTDEQRLRPTPSVVTLFLLSAAITMLQLGLMRLLSLTRWHHFSFLVISTALLGYGISGTLLWFLGERLLRRFRASCYLLCLAMAVATIVCFPLAEGLEIDTQDLLRGSGQLGRFLVYNLIVLVPFLMGAAVVGLSLMRHEREIGTLYASSLLGTAAGGGLGIGLMFVVSEAQLLGVAGGFGVAASIAWIPGASIPGAGRTRRRVVPLMMAAATCVAGVAVAWVLVRPPAVTPDPYKGLATVQRWASQGDAQRIESAHSPRGRIDVYASHLLHYTAFAGLGATTAPPRQLAIYQDGHFAGAVFEIDDHSQAPILDHVPASLAYRLHDAPRVLLLGEVGGVNVWLARRFGAGHIEVVQPDPRINGLLTGPLAGRAGHVLELPGVVVATEEPRLYLEQGQSKYDVIHVVTVESEAASASGLQTLNEDFLLTREGFGAAFHRLTDRGVLSLTRGLQSPPRDSLKLVLLARRALEDAGVAAPAQHIAYFRNYLAGTLLVFRTPPDAQTWARALAEARTAGMEPIFAESRSQGTGSTLAETIAALLLGDPDAVVDGYLFDIRAPTDDRPFFHDFFRLDAVGYLAEVYGDAWYRRAELGYAVLILVLVEATIVGLAFVLVPVLPVVLRRRDKRPAGPAQESSAAAERPSAGALWWSAVFYGAIGYAFMCIETLSISRFISILGAPVLTAAVVISALLVGAGLGSGRAGRAADPLRALRRAAVAVVLLGLGHVLLLDTAWVGPASKLPLALRAAVLGVAMAVLGYFMGFMFPSGLRLLSRRSRTLVPWAWSVNGFASVAAPPLAMVLVLSFGFRWVLASALIAYAVAGAVSPRLAAFAGPARRAPKL